VDMPNIDILRTEIDKFNEEMSRENYLHYSGQKDKLEIKPIYEKYGYLFTKDLAFEMRDLMQKTEKRDGENLKAIFSFVLFGWIGEKLKAEHEELANREAELKIDFRNEQIPYRSIPVRIVNIDDSDDRKELYLKKLDVDNQLTEEYHKPLLLKMWEMSELMGLGAYLPTVQTVTEVDYKNLSEIMNGFIVDTENLYVDVFDKLAKDKVGKPLSKCGYWDTGYLFRGKDFDHIFPADKLVPTMKKFFEDFGFPLDEMKAITVDVEPRPKKVPRAFCATVKVGKEVYINLQPIGGQKDYTTLLHESGHAYHYAFINPDLNVELKRLGDRAVSEGFAFLFNYLPENPLWCKRYLGVDDASGLINSELRQKLFFLRRYGAKLAYEIELHKDNILDGKDRVYKSKLQNALKFETPSENYLVDLDSGFYAADYLRAWIWEVQLRNHLEKKYGKDWFQNKAAGKEVCELWKLGKRYHVEEMARQLGYDGIDINPVKNTLIDGLKS
jgi:hypothetical protein